MAKTVISVENLTKSYQLGVINTGTFRGDLVKWWAKKRGKPDPLALIGDVNHDNRLGETLWALKDISFQVQQGEALGIIGRNGAGKSTLLKILSRVTAPTSGEIKVKGRIASLLEVGTGFHPELTGRENIFLNGAILGMNEAEIKKKLDEIVDFSGVEQFIDTPVKRYSSGMYVRLAFAVAAHLEPEILIVDEVLAVGDAEFQKKCLGKMGDVAHEGRTVLFVSHNMMAVKALCETGILLNNGIIDFSGTQTETINTYIKNISTNGESLSDFSHRPGNGQIRIIEVFISGKTGDRTSTVYSGQEIFINMKYLSGNQYFGGEARVGFEVFTKDGIKVFSQKNIFYRVKFNNLSNEGKFICHIPKLPLPAASYYISFHCKIDSEFTDSIEYGLDFNVIEGDFFGSGFIPTNDGTLCFVDADWNLE